MHLFYIFSDIKIMDTEQYSDELIVLQSKVLNDFPSIVRCR